MGCHVNETARQVSTTIEAVSKALSEWTVNRHVEADPALPERYGASWRADWTANVQSRLAYLAQAVAVRRSELFAQMMLWTAEAALARNAEPDDFLNSLEHMRHVLAQELPPPVAKTAAEYVDEALARLRGGGPEPSAGPGSAITHSRLVLRYLEAVLAGKRREAHHLVIEQARAGISVAELYDKILQPALSEIGRMWHRGEISVADEHFATATTQALLGELRPYFRKAETRSVTVVLAAVSGDFHDVGLRMVADCFEMAGWQVFFLGANMPADDIVEYLDQHPANVLALSASTCLLVRQAGELVEIVRTCHPRGGLKIIVGGSPFELIPDLWKELGADGCAHRVTEAVELANRLVS
jgi:methanogenic corrinoid protein MtbC1